MSFVLSPTEWWYKKTQLTCQVFKPVDNPFSLLLTIALGFNFVCRNNYVELFGLVSPRIELRKSSARHICARRLLVLQKQYKKIKKKKGKFSKVNQNRNKV